MALRPGGGGAWYTFMMLAPHALQPGSRLGGYVLERFLGEGGFAEVWLGRRADAPSATPVAIKLVRRGRFGGASQRTMFVDEANIAARIRHPNVASVLEIGDERGMPYLVMEYVAGGSLEAVVRGAEVLREPFPAAIAVRIGEALCAGLHAAHELAIDGRPQQVVHRDVSPQNILITGEGVPKLIDFGLAKARERLSRQTSTGITKGKVAYMSPEQARGESLDRRADVWSVAAVLYEALEGRPLVDAPNDVARLQALAMRPARLVFDRTPARLAVVLRRALSFRAKDRHATAEELRADLAEARALEGLDVGAAEVAAFCRRALRAAEVAAAAEPLVLVGFSDLSPAGPADVTISAVQPARPSSGPLAPRTRTATRARGRGIAIGVAAVAVVTLALAVRLGAGAVEARPAPPSREGARAGTPAGLDPAELRVAPIAPVASIAPAARIAPAAPIAPAVPIAPVASIAPVAPTPGPVSKAVTPIAASPPSPAPRRAPARTTSPAQTIGGPRPASPPAKARSSMTDDDRID